MAKKAKVITKIEDVAALRKAINEHFGPGTLRKASAPELRVQRIATGILAVDWMLDGGIVRGRHTEFYGTNGVGKTYTALHAIATTQANGGRCCYVDVERTFDPIFAESIGVDIEELELIEHRTGNQVIGVMQALIQSDLYDLIVCDSIAALMPQEERDNDMEEATFGTQQAKLMSGALRRLTAVNTGKTAIIWINQLRENINAGLFGKKTRTSGGMAMSFYAATRIEFVKVELLKRSEQVINHKTGTTAAKMVPYGHRILLKVEKEKAGVRPLIESTFVFNYDLVGHDNLEDLLYVGQLSGYVHKKGDTNWWVDGYDDDKQVGRQKFLKWLGKNGEIAEELEENIRDMLAAK